MEYKPRVLRHKLQISLWRADTFGVAKTKFVYFTPQSLLFDPNSAFTIMPSLDKETFMIRQEPKGNNIDKYLILVLDSYNLKVLHEYEVQRSDAEMGEVPGEDEYYDSYQGDGGSAYPTMNSFDYLANWEKGKLYFPMIYFNITHRKISTLCNLKTE